MLTLVLMGAATALIGLLPTYEAIGVWAPILLDPPAHPAGHLGGRRVGRRGAHGRRARARRPSAGCSAPRRRSACRSACCSPPASWRSWPMIAPGRRVPRVGLARPVPALRRADPHRLLRAPPRRGEPGVHRARRAQGDQAQMPIVQLFRKHALLVLIAALVFAGNNAVGYMTTGGYIQNYSTNPDGPDRPRARTRAVGGRGLRRRLAAVDVLRRLDLGPHRPAHDLHHRLDPAARRCLHCSSRS